MTKLIINDREYDGSLQPFIGDLRLLKKEFGFGWGTVAERLSKIDENADLLALIDDDGFVDALLAWMWMVRLRSGERDVSIDDIRQTPLDGFRMEGDDGEETDAESDPTSATTLTASEAASDLADPAGASTPATSRTSRRRSTAA